MTDSSWQHSVLRDIGVSQRGFQTLDGAPTKVPQGSWGAEAPRPVVEPEPQPVAEPAPQPVQNPSSAASEVPPFPAPTESAQPASGGAEPQPLLPPAPEPSPQAAQQAAAQQAAAQQAAAQQVAVQEAAPQQEAAQQGAAQQGAPQQGAAQQGAAQQGAAQQGAAQQGAPQQGAEGPAVPQQAEPLVHSEFDWEAAVNPVLGSVSSGEEAGQDGPEPAAASSGMAVPPPAPPAPHGQPMGPGHQIPADDLVRKNQHGDPLARRMGRGVRNAMGGGAREARERAAFADLMQRSVPSSRQIAVASVRGGAGKTTMAAMVATEMALHRADRVLAADADAELGSLPLRLGVQPRLSLFDLAAHKPNSFQEAEGFLTRTPNGLYVLSSTSGGRIAGEFTLETFQTALSAVSRYVAATVIDCGAGILTEVNRGVVASSHGLVLVTPGTVDGALSARGALEWYAANDQQGLLSRTVIAMVSHAPQVGADLRRAQEMLAAWGLPVVFVPYDRHLATGSSVELSKVSAAARSAFTRIVHEVFSRSLAAGGVR